MAVCNLLVAQKLSCVFSPHFKSCYDQGIPATISSDSTPCAMRYDELLRRVGLGEDVDKIFGSRKKRANAFGSSLPPKRTPQSLAALQQPVSVKKETTKSEVDGVPLKTEMLVTAGVKRTESPQPSHDRSTSTLPKVSQTSRSGQCDQDLKAANVPCDVPKNAGDQVELEPLCAAQGPSSEASALTVPRLAICGVRGRL